MACHRRMPARIRRYLNGRGIPDATVDRFKLGWNGTRITIPVHDRRGRFAYFRLAKDPDNDTSRGKMLSPAGAPAELYGWENVLARPRELVLCEGEFDRLALEARGVPAASSTAGAGTFRRDWAADFEAIPKVYICYDRDEAGRTGARRIAESIPHARIVDLPETVGDGGDITDFFVKSGGTRKDFRRLLDRTQPLPRQTNRADFGDRRPKPRAVPSSDASTLKAEISLAWLVGRYVALRPSGRNLVGRCPFHNDRNPSFVVFTDTNSFHCFGCKASGDCFGFLMRIERLTFPEALNALKRLRRP